MSFLGEIKRRKVFQVAAVYAVVAWLLIQVVDVVGEPLTLPDWINAVVIVLLAVGFPIAVILAWAFDLTPHGVKVASDMPAAEIHVPLPGQRLGYAIQGLILLAVAFLVLDQYLFQPRAGVEAARDDSQLSSGVNRFNINLGATEPVGNTGLPAHVALSRDGRRLVYAAQVDGVSQLYLRPIDQYEARPIPGTSGAFFPFFSPDGDWVGFYTDVPDAYLKKVSVQGGLPQTLADATWSGGGYWLGDDTIIYGTGDPSNRRVLFRTPATGGQREIFLEPEPSSGHVWPEVLPDGNAVLYTVRPGRNGNGPARGAHIAVLSFETGDARILIERGHTPRYASTGHILFARDGNLWAVAFDAERLQTIGPEVSVIAGVSQDSALGGAAFAISDDGMLVYASGGDWRADGESGRRLVWVDREGREQPLGIAAGTYEAMRLSPDGRRLAARSLVGTNSEIWIYDLSQGAPTRLTFAASDDSRPVWTPDGQRIVFSSDREGRGLHWKAADGTGQVERLTRSESFQAAEAWSPDGRQLIYREEGEDSDLYLLSMSGNEEWVSRPLLRTPFEESAASISPDGAWVAYQSNEGGPYEIYVRPFPDVESGRWQISTDGGIEPFWGPNGRELFYRSTQGTMSVSVTTEPSFTHDPPRVLIDRIYLSLAGAYPSYAVSPDGQRFLMIASVAGQSEAQGSAATQLNVVENWFEELSTLAPTE